MNALQSYDSDNQSDDGFQPKKMNKTRQTDTNYDDVGMDISEESGIEEDNTNNGASKNATRKTKECSSKPQDTNREPKKNSNRNATCERTRESGREGSSGSSSRDSRDEREHRHHTGRRDNKLSRPKDSRETRHRSHRGRRERSRSHERHRSRDTRRRSRSRSRDRKKPTDLRREAQQKLAVLKANPNFDQSEMLRQTMLEQMANIQKQTGITLPSYYNPATMNPVKIAEQERKKRLLWGNKGKPEPEAPVVCAPPPVKAHDMAGQGALWANTTFSGDSNGKMAQKFKRLMGVKGDAGTSEENTLSAEGCDLLKKQESLLCNMEKQYELARLTTHTQKGFGLGFSSQSFLPK